MRCEICNKEIPKGKEHYPSISRTGTLVGTRIFIGVTCSDKCSFEWVYKNE